MIDCLEKLLGEMSTTFEVREVMQRLPTVSRNTIVYYRQKALNTSFHPGHVATYMSNAVAARLYTFPHEQVHTAGPDISSSPHRSINMCVYVHVCM